MASENETEVPAPLEVIICSLTNVEFKLSDENSSLIDGWKVIAYVLSSSWSISNNGAAQMQAIHFSEL